MAAPSISTQNFISGCSLMACCRNSCASWIVYGCGKRSRRPSQTLRLFTCLTSDSASSIRHGRMVQLSRRRMHQLLRVEFDAGLLDFAVRQDPDTRVVVKIDNLDAIGPIAVKS